MTNENIYRVGRGIGGWAAGAGVSAMRQYRALDLFSGAGGATKGLQRAGFHVTGVDIKPQKRYCGDGFVQLDALAFPILCCARCLDRRIRFSCDVAREGRCKCGDYQPFDFIWASPPCQAFSALRHLSRKNQHPNLIPETRQGLIEGGVPYVIENVPGAPLGESGYLIMLCGTMFGLQTADGSAELRRHRLFECSFSIPLRPACQHHQPVVGIYGEHARDRRRETISVTGNGMGQQLDGRKRRTISITGNVSQDNTLTSNPRSKRDMISVCGHSGPGTFSSRAVRQAFTTQQAREAMGIDWMPMSSLSQAVPPAYSEWIGRKAIEYLQKGIDGNSSWEMQGV